jgi:N-glycosylase/DNA lyase
MNSSQALAAKKTVEIVVDGHRFDVDWGTIDQIGSAAYWVEQTRRLGPQRSFRLGQSLAEEVAACILGGHGIPAEVGLAAFARLRDRGLLRAPSDFPAISESLREPLHIPDRDRAVRYRFAKQRAFRISQALEILAERETPSEPQALRQYLLDFPGIGYKTASWIVRNWTGAGTVAIVDIHVHRAGLAAGIFSPDWRLPRDYELFEEAFCATAEIGGVSAASLDACIWSQMRLLGDAHHLLLQA